MIDVAALLNRGALRWHLLALAMARRTLVQIGLEPPEVESTIGGEGKRSHVGILRVTCERLGIPIPDTPLGVGALPEHDARAVARRLAAGVNPESDRSSWYPDGWREAYREIRASLAAPPNLTREREPGDDDE